MEDKNPWKKILEETPLLQDENLPKISILIPTLNCAPLIGITLENILNQHYSNYEILIIDAGSTDRTLEIIKSLRDSKIKIYSVSSYNKFEMLNKGIIHSHGDYINCLTPGDFYIRRDTLRMMMALALENQKPFLIYCGTMLREGRRETKLFYRDFTLSLLKKGKQPAALPACWFRSDLFKTIGKFDPSLLERGDYDLFCRLALQDLSLASQNIVMIDFDLRALTRGMVIRHLFETFKIISIYFGWIAVMKWLFIQKDTNLYFQLWFRSLKVAFTGKS